MPLYDIRSEIRSWMLVDIDDPTLLTDAPECLDVEVYREKCATDPMRGFVMLAAYPGLDGVIHHNIDIATFPHKAVDIMYNFRVDPNVPQSVRVGGMNMHVTPDLVVIFPTWSKMKLETIGDGPIHCDAILLETMLRRNVDYNMQVKGYKLNRRYVVSGSGHDWNRGVQILDTGSFEYHASRNKTCSSADSDCKCAIM